MKQIHTIVCILFIHRFTPRSRTNEHEGRHQSTTKDVVQLHAVQEDFVRGLARLNDGRQMPITHGPARALGCDVVGSHTTVAKPVGADELDSQFEAESGKVRARRERMIVRLASSSASMHPAAMTWRTVGARRGKLRVGHPVRRNEHLSRQQLVGGHE